jgi:general secretion pathway protein D
VLKTHGYAAVSKGDTVLIIQQNSVKQEGSNLNSPIKSNSHEILTKIIPISNIPALDLVPILRPLVAKHGHLAGVKSANVLIISDHANNISRMEQIIKRLDKSGSEELEVIQLKEAWVGNIVTMLQSLDPDKISKGGRGKSGGAGRISIVADERSNRLIVKGDRSARARVRVLIEKLDKPSYFSGSAKVIRLQYADAKKLAVLLKGVMGNTAGKDIKTQIKGKSNIYADEDLNALVVRAEPSILKEIEEIVSQLDIRRAQVLIEAAIVEVQGTIEEALGVQWGVGDKDRPVGGTNFSNAGASIASIAAARLANTIPALSAGLTLAGFKSNASGEGIGAIIQALASDANTNLLSTPSILTLDNQAAEVIIGQNVPFVTGSTASSSNSTPFTTVKREDVGIELKIVPHIHDGDIMRLEVEVSEESVAPTQIEGRADLITNKRSLKTMVLANNGEVLVLGGLIRDQITKSVSKVPLLGDIPLIGWLFRSSTDVHTKRNLMVFLKPTIVSSESKARELTRTKYNGLWEFELSNKIGVETIDNHIDDLFKGKQALK